MMIIKVRTLLVSLLAASVFSVPCFASEETSDVNSAAPKMVVIEKADLEGKGLPMLEPLAGEIMISGNPENWSKYLYIGQVGVGIWQSGAVKMRLNGNTQVLDEFFTVLEGSVLVTPQGGKAKTFSVGDSFVIPKGFVGTWETTDTYRHLAVVNPAAYPGEH